MPMSSSMMVMPVACVLCVRFFFLFFFTGSR